MAAQVLSFFQRSPRLTPHATPRPADWSQQELAEFYRVEGALIRAGISVGTDRGMSDENEPWFCFYRQDDGEVVIHFARIDGEYIIAGAAYEEIARGFDFTALVRNMVARHPLIRRNDSGGNLSIHPAALLVAVVGTAFFKTGEAKAGELEAGKGASHHTQQASRPVLLSSSSNAGLTAGVAGVSLPQSGYDTIQLPANQAVLILAAALLASDGAGPAVTVDPAARAAMAAAAAALDFGDVNAAPLQAGDSVAHQTVGTHAVTLDNSPAHTVSSVLTLVSLLMTLPHPAEGAGTSETVMLSGAAVGHDFTVSPILSTESAAWTIDVRLGLGLNGAPTVEAVQLVRGLVGEAGAQKISVIEVAKLPNILAELIAKGEHVTVAPSDHNNQTPDTPPTDTPETTTPPVGGNGETTPPLTPQPEPVPTAPAHTTYDIAKEFIDYFVAHTTRIEAMVNGPDIVMFDTRVLYDVSTISQLHSMSFHFDDGSSISLVGDLSSFLHGGILV
ncbi:hypothetical protein [Caulobacter sp. RHG1]|uniref:hypothetical protein n=1 Tax=Caulobacter sp. (strain RHG1) TaxID=2545762 RepID=UPI001552D93F|nr:hypothetical protein [Caulobacter sp. RHG1]NQE60880.1 hypothetical protein [Caulobacter sp. RHG1]